LSIACSNHGPVRVLAYIGVLLLFALTAGAVVVGVDAAFDLDRGLLENTRTPVPGSKVVHLEARKYNVFFEAEDLHGDDAPSLLVRVQGLDVDAAPTLKDYSGNFTISGSRDATAFATVRIPEAGHYRLVSTGEAPARFQEPEVVLGEPIGGKVGRIVGAALVGAVSFISGMALLILALLSRSRRRA
jgi:hypothetical protein